MEWSGNEMIRRMVLRMVLVHLKWCYDLNWV